MTSAVREPFVCWAICCAAASVSKLTLFHLPSRCSVIRRIFMAYKHPRFVVQFFHQLRCDFFGLTR